MTARGTESDIGDTILLITFLILIVASMLLGQILVRRRWSASVRWAGLFLLLAAPLRIPFLVLGGALSPDTDLGFWSALSVPYAIARVVLLAVFASRGDDMTTRPVATPVIEMTGSGSGSWLAPGWTARSRISGFLQPGNGDRVPDT